MFFCSDFRQFFPPVRVPIASVSFDNHMELGKALSKVIHDVDKFWVVYGVSEGSAEDNFINVGLAFEELL